MSLLQQVQLLQRQRAAKRRREAESGKATGAAKPCGHPPACQPTTMPCMTERHESLSSCTSLRQPAGLASPSGRGNDKEFAGAATDASALAAVCPSQQSSKPWTSNRCNPCEAFPDADAAFVAEVEALSQPAARMPAQPSGETQQHSSLAAFYGSKTAARLTAVELRIQRFLGGVRQRLQPQGPPLKTFPLQAPAIQYADSQPDGFAAK